MNNLILFFSSHCFVKQESTNSISVISYNIFTEDFFKDYGLTIVETHHLINDSIQYVVKLIDS